MTITLKTREFLLNVIAQIDIPEQFYSIEEEEDFTVLEDLQLAINKCGGTNWEWRTGASKLVILFFDLGVALKIPFNGSNSNEEIEQCALDDPEYFGSTRCCHHCSRCSLYSLQEPEFTYFRGASRDGESWDYCETEEKYYREAEDEGFAQFFAYTEFLGETNNGYPVYIQELCPTAAYQPPNEALSSCSINSKTHARELYQKHKSNFTASFDEEWATLAIEKYGQKLFDKFMLEFQIQHDYIFQDMHKANYGYRADGSPVIFDFSGYWE